MITYLQEGWYTQQEPRQLRNEVIDGAIDAASMLFRAGVPLEAIRRVAMLVRSLASMISPTHLIEPTHQQTKVFTEAQKAAFTRRLNNHTDKYPALQSLILSCLEHVRNEDELLALYLHMMHITQMAQLLLVAKLSGAATELGLHTALEPSQPTTPDGT